MHSNSNSNREIENFFCDKQFVKRLSTFRSSINEKKDYIYAYVIIIIKKPLVFVKICFSARILLIWKNYNILITKYRNILSRSSDYHQLSRDGCVLSIFVY